MKILKSLALLGIVLLLSSCCSCRKSSTASLFPLEGTSWTLIQLNGKLINATENYFLVLEEDKGSLHGRGNCNRMTGTYTLGVEREITISGISATRMFCPDQATEDHFFKALEEAETYEIDGRILMFFTAGELTAIFEAAESAPVRTAP